MASKIPLDGIRDKILRKAGPISRVSVTNFATPACEIQALYRKMKVVGERSLEAKKSLEHGIKVHQSLDTFCPIELPKPTPSMSRHLPHALSVAETIARWNALIAFDSVREFPLYGEYNGIKLYGIADGLELDSDGKLMIVEDKTTLGRFPPQEYKMRLAYHQTLVYRDMFAQMMHPDFDIRNYVQQDGLEDADLSENLIGFSSIEEEYMPIEKLEELDEYENDDINYELDDVQATYLQRISDLVSVDIHPSSCNLLYIYGLLDEALGELRSRFRDCLPSTMLLRYQSPKDSGSYLFEYDAETKDQLMAYRGQLWLGEREPSPFGLDGRLFCKFCEFIHSCEFVARAHRKGHKLLE